MTVIGKDEFKVFYGVRKTARVATIAEAHEAIKGSRNVVNVVVLLPNASDPGNQESDTEEVSTESIKEIYKPAGELGMEEDFESDDEAELPLPTIPKENDKMKKKFLVLKELFKGKNQFYKKFVRFEGKFTLPSMEKIVFREHTGTHCSSNHIYSNQDQNNPHFIMPNKEMPIFSSIVVVI